MRLATLLAFGALLVAQAAAQAPAVTAPFVANDLVRPIASGFATERAVDPEPDTTAPWRYYPLAVGNVWEYELNGGYVAREAIFGDTLFAGRRYFVRSFQQLRDDVEAPVYRTYLRYDSTSATFRAYLPESGGGEEVAAFPPCPFDTPPGEAVCDGHSVLVEEDPDGALVFGGDEPGAGPDTVRTAVKSFYTSSGFVRRYAAGVGLAYDGGEGGSKALTYYRVGGEEHGTARFPVASASQPLVQAAALDVWPNPTSGPLTVSVRLASSASDPEVAVYDILGRAVRRVMLGPRAGGEVQVRLDLSDLPPGPYAFVLTAEGARAVTLITTVAR